MKAYKGFDKDMKCRGFQFEQGKTYEEEQAILCEKGFHACENPLDVLVYYNLLNEEAENNRFAEVALEATKETKPGDTKRVGKKINIRAELTLKGLITAAVDFVFESNKSKKEASGDGSRLAASGDGSKLAASGYGSQLAASGYSSQLAASGDGSQLAASGDGSVVMNAGINGQAKAAKGSWITLAEWDNQGGNLVPVSVVSKKVDGVKVKANTWYSLEKGKFKEVK
jgi:hypothetical protein